jgi:hypothetical protein
VSSERSAYEIPGFATGRPTEPAPSFPLIPLIDPDRLPSPESRPRADQPPPVGIPTGPAPAKPTKAPSTAPAQLSPPGDIKTAKLSPTDPQPQQPPFQPRPEQWTVVVTANASYFNLGGHVDKAGVVDGLVSSHPREALKAHRNFGQLPPDIRTHFLTKNISLPKLAPYRNLVGISGL